MKILLLEPDLTLAKRLEKTFTGENYVVERAEDGKMGLELLDVFDFDLVLCSAQLPQLSGIELCKQLRSQGKQVAIIVTATAEESECRVAALDAGADDFIDKDIPRPELLARIRALLRRGSSTLMPVLEWRQVSMDTGSCQVSYRDKAITLTRKEYNILELFMRNTRRIYSQSAILDLLWSFDETPGENTVRAHIKSLRNKLKKAGAPKDLIETVYGLGYRLKEIPEEELQQDFSPIAADTEDSPSESSETSSPELSRESIPEDFLDIWQQASPHIQERISVIVSAVTSLKTNQLSPSAHEQAHQEAHTLVGSLGAFELNSSAQLARQLQQLLNPDNPPSNAAALTELETLLQQLQQTIAALDTSQEPENSSPEPKQANLPESPQQNLPPQGLNLAFSKTRPQLLVVDDDTTLTSVLRLKAIAWGMAPIIANSIADARDAISQHVPDAILLDLGFPDTADTGFTLLEELSKYHSEVPVLVFTAADDFATRVKVARMGGQGFLQKPIAPRQVMEAISQVLTPQDDDVAKVVVVDDDPQVLDTLRAMLQPWGVQLVLSDEPEQFWPLLLRTNPDLLILDEVMPTVTGIDLCQVVRNDPHWGDVPILVLAENTDSSSIQKLFTAGAEDYIRKPIAEPELVARVLAQLERSPRRSRRDSVDRITGGLTRNQANRALSRLLALAKRHQQSLGLVTVTLEDREQLEAQYGLAAFHQVLRVLSEYLHVNLRQEDLVVRWEGSLFLCCLYASDRYDCDRRFKGMLQEFQTQNFTGIEGQEFQVSPAFGIAEYGVDGYDLTGLLAIAQSSATSIFQKTY